MRRRFVTGAVAVMALASPAVVFAQARPAVAEEQRPEVRQLISVESTEIDLGKVTAGQEVVGTFVFHNSGERPVKILRAKPT